MYGELGKQVYCSPDSGATTTLTPGVKPVAETIARREELIGKGADNMRRVFRELADTLQTYHIPFPSSCKYGDEDIIFDEIGEAPSPTKPPAALEEPMYRTDRVIHAMLAHEPPSYSPSASRMITWASSGNVETGRATFSPDLVDEHGQWEFHDEYRRPATNEEILLHSLSLVEVIFDHFEQQKAKALVRNDQALLEKSQRALRMRKSVGGAVRRELLVFVKEFIDPTRATR